MKPETHSFLLKEPKAQVPTPINFFMTTPDGKVKRSILKKIKPADWDFAKQYPKNNPGIEDTIDDINQAIKDLLSICRRNRTLIKAEEVEAELDIVLQNNGWKNPKKKINKRNMIEDFEAILKLMADGTVKTPDKKQKRYEPKTIIQYEKWTRLLKQFLEDEKLKPHYEKVTMETYSQFISWGHKQNYSNSTIGKGIACWKRLADIAHDKKWHSNPVFKSDTFVQIREETDDIYLDDKKIQAIYDVKPAEEIERIARDWWVLDCYLGLRVSDLSRVGDRHFTGPTFQFVNQKTGERVVIPIHPMVRKVISNWKGLPPPIKDQEINDNIKIVAKAAKLTALFIYKVIKGGRVQVFEYEEWQMVSTHTARRSFITRLLRMGIPPHQVMKLTGIKRYETLMKYEKQSIEEVAQDVAGHDYFKGKGSAESL